ncbi:hypothetical protein M409DRAFT_26325 [Zasmidium cellare ATCC 36951]|uniref:G-protein coupled receptors family 1 profile domain-containing protein n=1 Tax=Zasmidium cellare ATCC 36951 TaxID=1080233 RepID=A0A6A6C8X0_ZASCE|nr:uncharacterized protein M409DRAFT_26325 [Zasmidium cellare ATCC 36951]KAF2163283.1 hypothetical protein M409DRAFT_26325 [Zasmidium cellare ATCC 36951]
MAIIPDDSPVRLHFLLPGDIVSILISLIALPAIAIFIVARWPKEGTRWTVATFLCLLCYATDMIFITTVTMLVHTRATLTPELCDSMMIICVILHNIAKATELAFLIERAYIITWPVKSRHETPEYILSTVGIFVPYVTVTAVAIAYRIAYVLDTEVCIIGMRRLTLMPMLAVETAAQLYLTLRFLQPLLRVHQDGSGLLSPLRKVVIRTSIGCAITMLLDVAVKVSLTLFNGEPSWLCYLTCKAEAFLAASILFWITKPALPNEGMTNGEQELGVGFEGSVSDSVITSSELAETCRQNFVKRVLSFPNAYETKIPRTHSVAPKS